ncbi:MAG TPA: hypothetical protein VHB25_08490 [Gemmatimonadaceae bacterium]|nr:hypothetical protein [Gemmatimonadaceae bacterium]
MSAPAEYDAFYNALRAANVGELAARRFADAKFGRSPAAIGAPDVDEGAPEKAIEHAGDKLMLALGFEVVRFSHPGKTKQTPGIADRRYYRRPRVVERRDGKYIVPALVLWWEAKSDTGRQRPDQRLFQEMVEACGEHYVLGTHDDLIAWLVEHRVAVRVGDVLEPIDGPHPLAS